MSTPPKSASDGSPPVDTFEVYDPNRRYGAQDAQADLSAGTTAPPSYPTAVRSTNPPERSNNSRDARRVWITAGVVAFGASGVMLGNLVFGPTRIDATYPNVAITNVVVDVGNGDVEINDGTGVASSEVRTRCASVDATVTNGTLTISSSCDSSTDVELNLPNGIPVKVRVGNGRIEGNNLESSTVDVAADNGRIDLEFDSAPTEVQATTNNGKVEVNLPRPPGGGGYRFDVLSDNGKTEVPASDGERLVRLRTSNGAIEVQYD